MARSPFAAGHSLFELLVVVVVVGVLTSLAAPSLRQAIALTRTRAALQLLAADLYRARALAARDGRELRIRFEPPGTGCVRRYVLEDPAVNRELLAVDLEREAPGVCLQVSGSPQIRINARGMPAGASRKVRARHGAAADSFSLSLVGRVLRSGYASRWAAGPRGNPFRSGKVFRARHPSGSP
jgi:type II secretory pathway pseudopilin PulG